MKYQEEKITEAFVAEVTPLLERHYEEIAYFKDIPLNPGWDFYKHCVDHGLMHIYTVRTDAGALVGYACFVTQYNKHYTSSLQAASDVFFIDKSHRSMLLVAKRFIEYCDEELTKLGVEVVYHRYKIDHPALGMLLEHVGYKEVEVNCVRRLK